MTICLSGRAQTPPPLGPVLWWGDSPQPRLFVDKKMSLERDRERERERERWGPEELVRKLVG